MDFRQFLTDFRNALTRGETHASSLPILPAQGIDAVLERFTYIELDHKTNILRLVCRGEDVYVVGMVFDNVVVRYKSTKFETKYLGIPDHDSIDWNDISKRFDFEPSYSGLRGQMTDEQRTDAKEFRNSWWVNAMKWSCQEEFQNVSFVVDGSEARRMRSYGPLTFLKGNISTANQIFVLNYTPLQQKDDMINTTYNNW
ncbi:hypothetical protein ACFE04_030012 [Oxalis oulophora]